MICFDIKKHFKKFFLLQISKLHAHPPLNLYLAAIVRMGTY